jgi:hypothetical protein
MTMKQPKLGSYRDADGARHELVVRETADGGWHVLVLDLDGETAHVVDALAGDQDGRPQPEAIARDYLTTLVGTARNAGRTSRDLIPEQGGPDARTHPCPRPGPRTREARGTALPRAAR